MKYGFNQILSSQQLNNLFHGDDVPNASTMTVLRDIMCQKIWDMGLRFDGSEI